MILRTLLIHIYVEKSTQAFRLLFTLHCIKGRKRCLPLSDLLCRYFKVFYKPTIKKKAHGTENLF